MPVSVTVQGVPDWVPTRRLLGEGDWEQVPEGWRAALERNVAADLCARLRGIGLGGEKLQVQVRPPLKRPLIRAARTEDARRRRQITPGFLRAGVRLDPQSRALLTPEALALALARRFAGRSVVDCTCGAGGNAIAFARAGCAVTAIDLDPERIEAARHNARIYGVQDRITFRVGRAQDLVRTGDLLFIDPPWGMDWDRAYTPLAALPLLAELWPLGVGFQTTLAKVPPSFDPSTLPDAAPEAVFGEAEGDYRRVKFVLLRRR